MSSLPPLPNEAYSAAIAYLYDRINYEKTTDSPYHQQNFRLSRMERLLVELDHPQQAAPVIHIAGSKGKGSVAWLMAGCLQRNGYRTGLYTSPHLLRLEERFVVDGVPISPAGLVQAVAAVRPAAEKIASHGHGHATFFELTTAMAWWYFRQQGCDACVIEVGLGGRLDSTNVCWPALSMITSISYDHQAQLGNTLTEIAGEKAGIIKPGVPVVSGATHPEAAAVIQRVARERGCLLRELDRDFSGTAVPLEPGRAGTCVFDYRPLQQQWSTSQPRQRMALRLLGRHQIANACLVLASLDILAEQGWQLEESKIREALRHTQVPGRIQSVAENPLTIVDTAHNEASVEALIATLAEYYPDRRRSLVFSASRDKQWKRMLDQLLPTFDRLILTQFRLNPRAVPVETLYRYAEDWKGRSIDAGLSGESADRPNQTRDLWPHLAMAPTPAEALKLAQQSTGADELLVIAGSFFLAAEVLEALRELRGQCSTNNAKTE